MPTGTDCGLAQETRNEGVLFHKGFGWKIQFGKFENHWGFTVFICLTTLLSHEPKRRSNGNSEHSPQFSLAVIGAL
jgi:hypothetical protein